MVRKCICYVTKEEGTTDTFYKDGKHYFKNKEIADEYKLQNSCRAQVIDILAEIIGYEKGQKFPSLLTKTLKELSDFYKWEVVLQTVEQNRASMENAILHKNFGSEYAKYAYLMAIIRNSIDDVNRKYKINKTIVKSTQQKEPAEVELMAEHIENIGTTKGNNDISKFLEDDLWN